jgi:hypothetical protein
MPGAKGARESKVKVTASPDERSSLYAPSETADGSPADCYHEAVAVYSIVCLHRTVP